MLSGWPASWVSWSVGGAQCVNFPWLFSVPSARGRVDVEDAIGE
jgi:hypothetical protein